MTAQQTRQLTDQMRDAQAQHTTMMLKHRPLRIYVPEKLPMLRRAVDFWASRRDRKGNRTSSMARARSGSSERVFRGYAEAAVPSVSELVCRLGRCRSTMTDHHVEKARRLGRSWCNAMSLGLTREQRINSFSGSILLEDKTLVCERMIKTYKEQTEKVLAEDFRIGIWLSNAPESTIKTHMLMSTELVCLVDFRQQMMLSYARDLRPSAGLSPTPMDIGAFSFNKQGLRGQGQERPGKSGHTAYLCSPDHVCTKCEKRGHRADKCWFKTRWSPLRLSRASRTNASVSIAATLGIWQQVARAR